MPLKDIPTSENYRNEAFLCAGNAFSVVFDVLEARLEAKDRGIDLDPHTEKEYNQACQHRLRTALVFTQQSYEMFFRAVVCKVSPYLLLPDTDWIKRAAKKEQSFPELRSVSAIDLPDLVRSVTKEDLSESIFINFEKLRLLRNQLVHAATSIVIDERQLLKQLSLIFRSMGWRNLLSAFQQYEASSHTAILFDPYLGLNRSHSVLDAVRDRFGPLFADEVLLSTDGIADAYCSSCFAEFEDPWHTAFQKTCLITNEGLRCAVCDVRSGMVRLRDRRTLFFDLPDRRYVLAVAGDGSLIGMVDASSVPSE